ncbi:GGDEF domain-containing protein [Vibrio sp.]|nr:GGDEF domain-containing protein [Vibrio sp.]
MSFRQKDVVLANFEGHVMSHKRTEMLSGISLKRQYPKLWESITVAQKSSFSVSDNNVTALVHRIEFIGGQYFYLIKIVNDDDLIPPYFYIVIVLLSLFLGGGYYLSQLRKEKNTLKKLSYTDQLSGLHNRHYLSEISRQLACDKRYHLCIFDIDHFKRVNDKYGHDIGDQVIKRVADVLKSQMKMGDMAFRIGGEEFLVIMKVDSREVAIHRVERIRKMVQELPQKPSVSISGGLCCINRPIEEVIKCADAQLYQAKQSGRNIIVC